MDSNDINIGNLKQILKENIMRRLFENQNEIENQTISDDYIETITEDEIKALLSAVDNQMMSMIQNQIKKNEEMRLNQRICESKINMINQYINQ